MDDGCSAMGVIWKASSSSSSRAKKSVGYDIKQQLGAEGEEHRGFVHKIIKKNNPMLLRQIGLREEVEGLPPPLDL